VLENDRGVKSSGIDGVEYVDCSCGGCEGAGFDGVGVWCVSPWVLVAMDIMARTASS
jgi:hypothetical protein